MPEGRRRAGAVRRAARWLFLLLLAGLFAAFVALGSWQVQRRAWKLDLIERVEQRVHAAPVPAPGPAEWPAVTADAAAYRHVRITGTFLHDRETLVQASTVMGPGHWVLTPLHTREGWTVLVNRGFVPSEFRDPASRRADAPVGDTTVTGLLRVTEPHGGFLRTNDPSGNRWYSRDVPAIAAVRGVAPAAPYFIDAEAVPAPAGVVRWPAGGLTVVSFPNSHLVYAITWFTLAGMVAAAAVYVYRKSPRDAARP